MSAGFRKWQSMSQPSTVPEYTVASEKIALTEKQLDNLILNLQDMEVDSQVLHKELTKLEGFSGRIADDIRALVLLLREQQSLEVSN